MSDERLILITDSSGASLKRWSLSMRSLKRVVGVAVLVGIGTLGALLHSVYLHDSASKAALLAAQNQVLQQQIAQLQAQLQNSTQKVQDTEKASLVSYENQLKDKLKLAEEGYKSAYDSGDKDKLLEAQKAIADTTTELRMVDAKRFYIEDQAKKGQPQQQTNGEAQTVEQPQPQQPQTQATQQPKLHKLAREWISDNSEWYNKDRISTQAAHVINEDLLQEGFDPETEEFYTEISKRLKKELPHKFGQQEEPTNKPAQVVAGKSRTSASSKGKIRLSQEDVRLAKKMGVPLDVYAKEKAKVEKAGDDYTTVNV